jgi:outer membrane protein OmpA-like peptidoglycan-associated protein
MSSRLWNRLHPRLMICLILTLMFTPVYPARADDCKRIQNILVLFDASGFMKDRDRLEFLRKQLSFFEKAMPVTKDGFFNVGLRHYGLRVGMGCHSTESILAISPWDPERFINSVPETVSYGTAALSAGLRGAAEDVADVSGKSVILVIGGGTESCKSDPLKIASQIAFNNPNLEIHTFQIGKDQEGRFFLKGIAKRARGTYQAITGINSPASWHRWMKRNLVEPCREPARPPATEEQQGFGVVAFDSNSISVKSKDVMTDARNQKALASVAKHLLQNPADRMVLHGYSDGKGKVSYNIRLSRKRAEAVAHFLNATFGIPIERMSFVAHGPSRAGAQYTAQDKPSRRVEFEILR